MPTDLFINWSSQPTYCFKNGEQRVANLSAAELNDLGTLRITEDGDGYGTDSLNVQGTYQFKRLELEKFKGSLQHFPTCFGTDFEEVSLYEVAFNDDASEEHVKKILKSPNLKSLKIENVSFTDGMFRAITDVIYSLQYEHLEITEVTIDGGDFTHELESDGFGKIVEKWRKHRSPKLRTLSIGEIGDDYSMDIKDIFRDELRAHVFFNREARQWMEVYIRDPFFNLTVKPANTVKDIPKRMLKELLKEDLIAEISILQTRVGELERRDASN